MPVDLDELERLEKAATRGPWRGLTQERAEREGYDWACVDVPVDDAGMTLTVAEGHVGCPILDEDAVFIAALRNAAPELIAELRRLREENAKLERWILTPAR